MTRVSSQSKRVVSHEVGYRPNPVSRRKGCGCHARRAPTRHYEGLWRRAGLGVVAGVDEAGRGCLAGPVVAAALILPKRVPHGINDSKKLTPRRREHLLECLQSAGSVFAWGQAEAWEIDQLNIREASFLAMRRAVAGLVPVPQALLVDGFLIPDCDIPQRALIGGDARALSIAAASIVAKVTRDRIMVALAAQLPAYGFDQHKGYPTTQHMRALRRHGPSRLHRQSFRPVREASVQHCGISLQA